jgi:glycerophosphoryl diester phosphodiesterase
VLGLALVAAGGTTGRATTMTGAPADGGPLVIAHRGASGYLPEHTLEAYLLGIEQGADFIEPDLVATRDGRLVARHEPNITTTTDVASRPEFADRKRRYVVDGREEEGWFTVDFTLEELRTLRAVQSRPERPQQHNGRFAIPTFEEVIELAQREGARRGRSIGVYPETKHPTWHCERGLPLEEPMLAALRAAGWTRRSDPVFLQSFESGNLRWLRSRTDLRLVQLIDAAGVAPDGQPVPAPRWTSSGTCRLYPQGELPQDFADPRSFAQVAAYADVIAPWKRFLVGVDAANRLTPATRFVERARAVGLGVHTWTFRNEPAMLAADYAGDPTREYAQFLALGIDGLFSDFPDTAVAARAAFLASTGR